MREIDKKSINKFKDEYTKINLGRKALTEISILSVIYDNKYEKYMKKEEIEMLKIKPIELDIWDTLAELT